MFINGLASSAIRNRWDYIDTFFNMMLLIWCCEKNEWDITKHRVPKKHFLQIFENFWTSWFRIFRIFFAYWYFKYTLYTGIYSVLAIVSIIRKITACTLRVNVWLTNICYVKYRRNIKIQCKLLHVGSTNIM